MINVWQQAVADLQKSCRDLFGVPVTYFPSIRNRPEMAGRGVEVVGIFDNRRETITIMGTNSLGAVVPNITMDLRVEDLGFDPMEGDEITMGTVSYRVRDVLPDDCGTAILTLDRLPSP